MILKNLMIQQDDLENGLIFFVDFTDFGLFYKN